MVKTGGDFYITLTTQELRELRSKKYLAYLEGEGKGGWFNQQDHEMFAQQIIWIDRELDYRARHPEDFS